MSEKLEVSQFLTNSEKIPIIDVRSPAEFEQGHIPDALNIPLFSNEERAQVGIRYKQAGNEFAVLLGLEIVGPKLADLVKQAKKIAIKKQVLVHCWRGGMRSASMAWLFETAGLKADIMQGGYKAYRAYIAEQLLQTVPIIILGGYTGSGKTDILMELQKKGEQIIDLEGLAHHKGSAFGSIGELPQPTNEQFFNNLGKEWIALDFNKRVWLEDESVTMGHCGIPAALYNQMRRAEVINLDIPKKVREKRLVKEYANGDISGLENALLRISKKLGGLRAKTALDALKSKDFIKVAEISLEYYDKAYAFGLSKRDSAKIQTMIIGEDHPEKTADILVKLVEES